MACLELTHNHTSSYKKSLLTISCRASVLSNIFKHDQWEVARTLVLIQHKTKLSKKLLLIGEVTELEEIKDLTLVTAKVKVMFP